MIDYKGNPFFLDEQQIQWVENVWESMTSEEKIGQLFCPIVFTKDEKKLDEIVLKKHVGGILYRECPGEELQKASSYLQQNSKIPLLIAANLESGGNGAVSEGTCLGSPMLVSATGDPEIAYHLGKVCAKEGAAAGVNWAFAPVVDLDLNYHNPITNVRTFGNNPETVINMGKNYIKACQESGVATACKHFPGDGVDERDQHLVTSVNSLDCEGWDKTYGEIYQEMIEMGTLSIMAGHIALPSYEKRYGGAEEKIIPATLSKNLLQHLLREKLGFNGLITTDAIPMAGFCSAMDRETAVPTAIENGCDMFLFNRNLDEDIAYMTKGYCNGLLSEERLEEAVKRILAMKAALELPEKKRNNEFVLDKEKLQIINCKQHKQWAQGCAKNGITLVKDTQKLLPLSNKKYKRVILEMVGDFPSNLRVEKSLTDKLQREGFEVTVYQKEGLEVLEDTVESLKTRYDLIIYAANIETASNHTTARLNWHTMFGLGTHIPWMVHEIPVMFISFGNPYHLLDVPMIKTYINAYGNSECLLEAAVEKIMGKSPFMGKSPIDPFCGRKDLGY